MNAMTASALDRRPVISGAPARSLMIGVLRALLWAEALIALGLTVLLSQVAFELAASGADGRDAAVGLRFAAGGAILFSIAAAVTARGARRRRSWAWTASAILQVLAAVGVGVAVLAGSWHPAYLAAFGMASAVMLVISSAMVRRLLGQE